MNDSILRAAIRFRNIDGVFTKIMDTLTGGPFLAGLALALGANNFQIGLVAAIPFLAKIAFIPAVWLVERVRKRRLICVVSTMLGRPFLLLIALGVLVLPPALALWGLIAGLLIFSVMATFAGLAWNVWMKDLLPDRIRGRVFSKRLWIMGVVGMVLSLFGALTVDALRQTEQGTITVLAMLFGVGAIAGIIGIFFLSRIPERPSASTAKVALKQALAQPFKNPDFKKLVMFTGSWAFATNLALPFITVYMLSVLGLPFFWVIVFTVVSQLSNLSFLGIWGRVADRYGNKAVLGLCAPVFSLSLLLWIFTINDHQWVTLTLIALIHIMNGIATAGIDVSNDNILFKLAPKQFPTPYMAAGALINSLSAGVAPLLGGALGNFFNGHRLTVPVRWDNHELTVISLTGLEFIFLFAFIVGMFALSRLRRVKERVREAAPAVVVVKSIRNEIQSMSSIRGMRHLTQAASFFAGLLLESGTWLNKPGHDDLEQEKP